MTKPTTFILKNEAADTALGTITFNGKFVFVLDPSISLDYWNRIGFIPLSPDKHKAESNDLFFYLNSRLPINLRDKSAKEKLEYIKDSGLRVASDSLVLLPA